MKRIATTLLVAAACAAAFAQQPAPAADAAAPKPKTPAMQIDDLLTGAGVSTSNPEDRISGRMRRVRGLDL